MEPLPHRPKTWPTTVEASVLAVALTFILWAAATDRRNLATITGCWRHIHAARTPAGQTILEAGLAAALTWCWYHLVAQTRAKISSQPVKDGTP
jgi:hypothetical protein